MDVSPDLNGIIAGLLRDLASVQPSERSGWGYKRAANAIMALERPIETLVRLDGALEKIPNVGPKSEQVVLEYLTSGHSSSVELAVGKSGKEAVVARQRGLRGEFLSRAQVVEALEDDSLGGPSVADYRGDLQMHSTWSDGTQTLEEIVEAGIALGYEFCGVTDHSYGLPIARGVSMADLAKQHLEIDRLNHSHAGRFRLIKGIEANIAKDGSIDMSADELAELEFVLVAPHSSLRVDADQTDRMIAAVRTPHVHILGHPRGRQYETRAGVQANWDDVFAAAAEAGVAIEIDGDPSRQDLDYTLARRALEAGCLFALDSDAHSPSQLAYAETAIAHARIAGVPVERIVNCWPVARVLDWLRVS